MYSFLDRRLHKLSIDTLFTPFELQTNKLGEEKRGKKLPVGEFCKLHLHNNFKNVLSGYILILHSLSFPTVSKTPKTEFEIKIYEGNKMRVQNRGRLRKFAHCEFFFFFEK